MGDADAAGGDGGVKRRQRRLGCQVGALIAVVVALAATAGNYRKVPLFEIVYNKSTDCPPVNFPFFFSFEILFEN